MSSLPRSSASRFFRGKLLFTSALVAILPLAFACGPEVEYKAINFSAGVVRQASGTERPAEGVLRVAVAAMVSPEETLNRYKEFLDHLKRRSGREVFLIQRRTYGEVNDLFPRGEVDLAFLCSGPYALLRERLGFHALAAPVVGGRPFYQSYLIVPRQASASELEHLRGGVFAFTDPESNTGHLVPRYWLAARGERPENFFRKTIFTYSHDNSILAVARGLVDGAAVDSHLWEHFTRTRPELTSAGRVILRSEPFGSPPIVASRELPENLRQRLQEIVLSMHADPEGGRILQSLGIERFGPPQETWYDPIRRMHAALTAEIL
ncbi:MAG: phosphate/phosphite/phosphonate ABC transporter substrate-binding protein [Desulfobacterales bacterium]